MQAAKNTSKRIHPGFETQGTRHQKFKTGISMVQLKGLMFSKKIINFIFKKNGWC